MNQSNYFPHNCDARNDDKIIKARMALGSAEGYAAIFMLYERLCAKEDHKEEANYSTLAFDLRMDKDTVRRAVEDFGLFLLELGEDGKTYFYTSPGLTERLAPLDAIRKKRKEAGQKGGSIRVSRSKKNVLLEEKSSKSANLLEKNPSKSDVLLEEKSSKSANLLEKKSSREDKSRERKATQTTDVVLCCQKKAPVLPAPAQHNTAVSLLGNNWSATLTDGEYLEMAEELLNRFASAPTEEIQGIVDLCHPEWRGQYSDFSTNKKDVIGKLYKIPDEKRYRRSHGASRTDREHAALWIGMVAEMQVYDPLLLNCYRGMAAAVIAGEFWEVTLYVRSRADIEYIEDKLVEPLGEVLRRRFGENTHLEYGIKK